MSKAEPLTNCVAVANTTLDTACLHFPWRLGHKSLQEAQQYCSDVGMQLWTLRSYEQTVAALDYVKNMKYNGVSFLIPINYFRRGDACSNFGIWISLFDDKIESVFRHCIKQNPCYYLRHCRRWHNESDMTTWVNWVNDVAPSGGRGKNCVQAWQADGLGWKSADCSSKALYVCEPGKDADDVITYVLYHGE